MKLSKYLIALLTVMFASMSFGQSEDDAKKNHYKEQPVWIEMMNDPNANFYETIEAFKEYYEDRAMPEEPIEMRAGDSFEEEIGLEEYHENGEKSEKELERERKRDESNEPKYAAEVRAFRGWYYDNLNWLRANGSIISIQERQAIIDEQQQDLQEAEDANRKK